MEIAASLEHVSKSFKVYGPSGNKGLRKFRRKAELVIAVNEVSLQVPKGQMIGYIGPNGAGKSTTIKMLTGILVPTSGEVRVAGLDPSRSRREVAAQIGVVFGQRTQLLWDLPLVDSFELLSHVYGTSRTRYRANLDEFVDLLDMAPFLKTPVRQLSLGQRMRGDLAAAMLHDPPIVFLDEPTIGLDVVAKENIRQFLLRLNKERSLTLILTTHDMSDVERLCDRILIIDHGKTIYDGDIDAIKRRAGAESVMIVDLEDPESSLGLRGGEITDAEGPRRWIRFRRDEISAGEILSQITSQAQIRDLVIEEPAIEDLIRQIYADGLGT